MCEYSAKLVAWIDGEIPAVEAAEIARHVTACAECRSCAAEFRRVSGTFEEYCDAMLQANEPREASWRKPALLAAAAAILLVLVLTYSRRPVTAPTHAPSGTAAAVTNSQPGPNVVTNVSGREKRNVKSHPHRRPSAAAPLQARTQSARAQTPSAEALGAGVPSDEPALRIAIPADAMFAPGALPEGMTFVADLSIGADGRIEQLRLVPQPVPLERRLEQ